MSRQAACAATSSPAPDDDDATPNPTRLPVEPEFAPPLVPAEPQAPGVPQQQPPS